MQEWRQNDSFLGASSLQSGLMLASQDPRFVESGQQVYLQGGAAAQAGGFTGPGVPIFVQPSQQFQQMQYSQQAFLGPTASYSANSEAVFLQAQPQQQCHFLNPNLYVGNTGHLGVTAGSLQGMTAVTTQPLHEPFTQNAAVQRYEAVSQAPSEQALEQKEQLIQQHRGHKVHPSRRHLVPELKGRSSGPSPAVQSSQSQGATNISAMNMEASGSGTAQLAVRQAAQVALPGQAGAVGGTGNSSNVSNLHSGGSNTGPSTSVSPAPLGPWGYYTVESLEAAGVGSSGFQLGGPPPQSMQGSELHHYHYSYQGGRVQQAVGVGGFPSVQMVSRNGGVLVGTHGLPTQQQQNLRSGQVISQSYNANSFPQQLSGSVNEIQRGSDSMFGSSSNAYSLPAAHNAVLLRMPSEWQQEQQTILSDPYTGRQVAQAVPQGSYRREALPQVALQNAYGAGERWEGDRAERGSGYGRGGRGDGSRGPSQGEGGPWNRRESLPQSVRAQDSAKGVIQSARFGIVGGNGGSIGNERRRSGVGGVNGRSQFGGHGREGESVGGGRGRGPSAEGRWASLGPPHVLGKCQLCLVECNTMDVLRAHFSGKKHKKNVEKKERGAEREKNDAEGQGPAKKAKLGEGERMEADVNGTEATLLALDTALEALMNVGNQEKQVVGGGGRGEGGEVLELGSGMRKKEEGDEEKEGDKEEELIVERVCEAAEGGSSLSVEKAQVGVAVCEEQQHMDSEPRVESEGGLLENLTEVSVAVYEEKVECKDDKNEVQRDDPDVDILGIDGPEMDEVEEKNLIFVAVCSTVLKNSERVLPEIEPSLTAEKPLVNGGSNLPQSSSMAVNVEAESSRKTNGDGCALEELMNGAGEKRVEVEGGATAEEAEALNPAPCNLEINHVTQNEVGDIADEGEGVQSPKVDGGVEESLMLASGLPPIDENADKFLERKGPFFRCIACDVNCNSASVWTSHVGGRKHRVTVQRKGQGRGRELSQAEVKVEGVGGEGVSEGLQTDDVVSGGMEGTDGGGGEGFEGVGSQEMKGRGRSMVSKRGRLGRGRGWGRGRGGGRGRWGGSRGRGNWSGATDA